MFITFEGIDGCGKSTQIDLLKEYFQRKKLDCHSFREPGGTKLSEKIRSLLLYDESNIDPVTELLLFSAARSQLIAEEVVPLLEKGDIVILDRFYDSTVAYQGFGRKSASLEEIASLNTIAAHHLVPDVTFYLKIPLQLAAKRTEKGEKDRMENSGTEFYKNVIEGFESLSRSEDRFITIDATRDKFTVHRQIVSFLEKRT